MTAILSILNKTTVALAADSAATLTRPNGSKVYNHANKLFNLSGYAPVGVMLYNSAELVGIPWETIIKMYRRELGQQKFPKLTDYADHFLTYLETIKPHFAQTDKEAAVLLCARELMERLMHDVDQEAPVSFETLPEDQQQESLNALLIEKVVPNHLAHYRQQPLLAELADYDFTDFQQEYNGRLQDFLRKDVESSYGLFLSDETVGALSELVYEHSCRRAQVPHCGPWSGVVVTGFGEAELFPSLVSYWVGPVFGNVIRRQRDKLVAINSTNPSAIVPYAQHDVIMTFLNGVDPFLQRTITDSVGDTLDALTSVVTAHLPEEYQASVREAVGANQDKILNAMRFRINRAIQEKSVEPIRATVATLSKEDLTEMAESLINLTYLRRRVSFEQESVGGPVDVAVITKGEGFIWLKRKQYFRPELNLTYVGNVLARPPVFAALPSSHPQNSDDYVPDAS